MKFNIDTQETILWPLFIAATAILVIVSAVWPQYIKWTIILWLILDMFAIAWLHVCVYIVNRRIYNHFRKLLEENINND